MNETLASHHLYRLLQPDVLTNYHQNLRQLLTGRKIESRLDVSTNLWVLWRQNWIVETCSFGVSIFIGILEISPEIKWMFLWEVSLDFSLRSKSFSRQYFCRIIFFMDNSQLWRHQSYRKVAIIRAPTKIKNCFSRMILLFLPAFESRRCIKTILAR